MPRADVVVVMLSMQFFQSKACVKELVTAIELGKAILPVYLERVSLKGDFLGDSEIDIKTANFIRVAGLSGNVIPPPDQGFFQGGCTAEFKRNASTLAARLDVLISNAHAAGT